MALLLGVGNLHATTLLFSLFFDYVGSFVMCGETGCSDRVGSSGYVV